MAEKPDQHIEPECPEPKVQELEPASKPEVSPVAEMLEQSLKRRVDLILKKIKLRGGVTHGLTTFPIGSDFICDVARRHKGLSVLDLGCGSDAAISKGGNLNQVYSPDFCRKLHRLDANVIGVDIHNSDTSAEGWKFLNLDLRNPSVLDCFHDCSMDAIHSSFFLGHANPITTAPQLTKSFFLRSNEYREIEDGIFAQAIRILKPGGIFVICGVTITNVYQKDTGPLVFAFIDRSLLEHRDLVKEANPRFDLSKFVYVGK